MEEQTSQRSQSLRDTQPAGSNAHEPLTFSQMWRDRVIERRRPDDATVWDKRITDSPNRFRPGAYSQQFLALANLQPGDTVFDMGCGAGTLAIPCAEAGHQVTAADFSATMLAQLQANAAGYSPDAQSRITTLQLSWADDWQAAGIAPRSFDVAFASRSIITEDLEDSIRKLSAVASRKVCVTVTPSDSPKVFKALFDDLGLTFTGHPDASFVFAVATELGFRPEVTYLYSRRQDYFPDAEAAFAKYRDMLPLADQHPEGPELQRLEDELRRWLSAHLVPVSQCGRPLEEDALGADGDPEHLLTTDAERIATWAFITWEV
ncbi:MAG: class I SAM-dependent methyltransferase [Eggerthellaceae bacterium]